MNRTTFQRISEIRRREALVLLTAGEYPGAYYLVGYAVECALNQGMRGQTGTTI
jgi:hypothetical protein